MVVVTLMSITKTPVGVTIFARADLRRCDSFPKYEIGSERPPALRGHHAVRAAALRHQRVVPLAQTRTMRRSGGSLTLGPAAAPSVPRSISLMWIRRSVCFAVKATGFHERTFCHRSRSIRPSDHGWNFSAQNNPKKREVGPQLRVRAKTLPMAIRRSGVRSLTAINYRSPPHLGRHWLMSAHTHDKGGRFASDILVLARARRIVSVGT